MTALWRRVGAEFIGTYALVAAVGGAIVVNTTTNALTHIGIALVSGLVVMVMIAAVGHLSGAHFNPAVTCAFVVTRHFPWREVPWYVAGQVTGAVAGAVTVRGLFGTIAQLGATIPAGSTAQALVVEVLLTAVLMFVNIAVSTDTRAVGQLAALAVGATVALNALWGGPVSGASMNPARSFGPALLSGAWQAHWIYWVGPIGGAALGAIIYTILRGETPLASVISDE